MHLKSCYSNWQRVVPNKSISSRHRCFFNSLNTISKSIISSFGLRKFNSLARPLNLSHTSNRLSSLTSAGDRSFLDPADRRQQPSFVLTLCAILVPPTTYPPILTTFPSVRSLTLYPYSCQKRQTGAWLGHQVKRDLALLQHLHYLLNTRLRHPFLLTSAAASSPQPHPLQYWHRLCRQPRRQQRAGWPPIRPLARQLQLAQRRPARERSFETSDAALGAL
jgi:hypothetical protein